MGKPHKLANARIEIETALPVDRAVEVARQVVGTQRALKITGQGDGVLRVQVSQGLISAPVMTFLVSATSNGARTRVVSAIDEYRTSQTTVYFIPVTAKSMEGMGVYRRFMVSFGQAMQASDPSASIQMIERDTPGAAAFVAPPAAPAPSVPLPSVDRDAEASASDAGGASAFALPATVPEATAVAQVESVPAFPTPDVLPMGMAQAAPPLSNGTPLFSETNARVVQVVGGVIAIAGLIFWYATPSDVTVGPLLVILLGAVVAGAGFIIGRNAGRAAADELAAKLRNERTMAGISPTAPAVPLPPAVTVPMPPAVSPPTVATVEPLPPTSAPAAPLTSAIPPVPLPPIPTSEALVSHVDPIPAAQRFSPQAVPASAGPIRSIPGVAMPAAPVQPAVSAAVPVPAPDAFSAPAPVSGLDAPAASDDDLDSTRIAPTHAEWQLVLADGRSLAVASALRIGRDPIADPDRPGTVLVSIDDPARSLSKTHAQLAASPGVIVITDLHSTNGTKVRTADGIEIVLGPEIGHRVTTDADISFGDYVVRLTRHAVN